MKHIEDSTDIMEDPFLLYANNHIRLMHDYRKHGSLIVAFDFDNTVFDYHKNGSTYPKVVELLREVKALGWPLILFTAREKGERIIEAVSYCRDIGLYSNQNFYVNRSPVMQGTAKPYYNILLDDRAGLKEAYNLLSNIIKQIKDGKQHTTLNG
jgi:hypothetical protein